MTISAPTFQGSTVRDDRGDEVGKISDVLYDGVATEPTWFIVDPGFLRSEHYVPARGSYRTTDDEVVIPFTSDQVKHAPKARKDHVFTNDLRAELTDHYHLDDLL